MTIGEQLTKCIIDQAMKNLETIASEKSATYRAGLIIQAIRSAIYDVPLYIYNGLPHFFNGKIYVPLSVDEFKGCIYDILVGTQMNPADLVQLERFQRITLQAVQSKPLELRKDIIVFENCVLVLPPIVPADMVELQREKHPEPAIRKHSPKLAQTTMCHFDFDPDAECPRWTHFLEEVLDNAQMRMVLQEYLGCIYIDRKNVKLESMLILIGNGSNGKGVVSETVRGIVGEDSMTAFGLDSILAGGEAQHNIAKMNGMRVNWCTEIQALQAGRFSDKLKTLISGEPMECRQMYGQPFTATDIPLMVANCNALPPLQDKSYGMQRRFIIIRFEKTIPVEKQDKTLLQKLVPEYPGIFNWMLAGRQRFIDQHFSFTRCRAIDNAIENYIKAANNVEEWCTIKTYKPVPESPIEQQPLLINAATLYDEYRRWCISENITPFSNYKFGILMRQMGFSRTRSNKGNQYRLFGEKAVALLAKKQRELLEQTLKDDGEMVDGQIMRSGKVYDVSDTNAARQWHVSRPYLTILRNRGWLDGIFVQDVRPISTTHGLTYKMRVNVYDHIRLGRRLEEIGVYDESDIVSHLSERRQDQIRRAEAFNEEMKRLGKPFRKFEGKGGKYPKDAVFVDNDWEYTADNASLIVDQKVIEEDKRRKDREIKVGKAGEMRTKGRRKKLAEAIAAKLTGDPLGDKSGIDPETGEPIEVDIEDDDFRISEETEEDDA